MSSNLKIFIQFSLFLLSIYSLSCSGNDDDNKYKKDSLTTFIRKETKKEPDEKYQRPPIVNIVDTVTAKMIIIYTKDSAANFERISLKLGKIYGAKLPAYLKKNKLKIIGPPMAWYKKQKAPYFFEAGIPINKKGTKSIAGVQIREIKAGKAVIAHFYGPFQQLPLGYDAVKEWIKDNNKTLAGSPYETYVTDPVDKNGKQVDPYKIKTDIIFPIK